MRRRETVPFAILVAAALATSALAQGTPNIGRPEGPALPAQILKDQVPNTYGTSHSSFYRMGATEFTPQDSALDTYADTNDKDDTTYRRYGTGGVRFFIGTPHLPSGARVISIVFNGCAASTGSLFGKIVSCGYFGSACSSLAVYTGVAGCGSDYVDLVPAGYVVDNSRFGNQLVIRINTTKTDGSDSFSGVTVEYQLQVSPAPGTATFIDVPTDHPFFQFIEALKAAGITAGCTPTQYCPDAPLTRGQMAVFLAKALGLQWR